MADTKTEEATSTEVATTEGGEVEALAAPPPPVVPGVGDTGWRSWVAQQGGLLPPATPPTVFPGIGPIGDYINPNQSVPSYYPYKADGTPNVGASPYVPMNQNAVDPFAGWTAQKEKTGTMRPAVPGITA